MALNKEQLKQLMVATAKADRSAPVAYSHGDRKFTYEELNAALRSELNEIVGDYSAYRANKNILFELIEDVVDLVLPTNVMDSMKEFAEVKTFAHGDKPFFKRRQSQIRGRSFVTRVSPGGIYEAFKIDSQLINIATEVYGGAAQIGLEEFLEGLVDFAELMDVINIGLEIAVYKEVMRNLVALASNGTALYQGSLTNAKLPGNNVKTFAGWAPLEFNALLGVARAYGEPTIFCSQMFAMNLRPEALYASESVKSEFNSNGYLGTYNGVRVVVLPQSFFDVSNNTDKLLVPAGYAWIIPTGTDKPVKIAFEGDTVVEEFQNRDWSREIQVFKKFGVTLVSNPGICVYHNTALDGFPTTVGPVLTPASGILQPAYTFIF
jgi:hypothetical protein